MVSLRRVISPAPRDCWQELAERDRGASVTQTPDWLACISAVGAYVDASRLYCFDDGRRVVLPLAGRKYLPLAASWPFDWGIGGPLADGPIAAEHCDIIYADLAGLGLLQLTIRIGPQASAAWRAAPRGFTRTDHTTHVLDLDAGFDAIWSCRFRSATRRAVRKAERAGLDVEADTTGRLIPAFDELYRRSVDRWAREQHEPLSLARWRAHRANPRRKFDAVARLLGSRCAVWLASRAGEPVAAIIVLRHGGQAKYWRGAMNMELAGPTRANNLLHSLAIEAACRTGCRTYYMGDSRPGSGLAAFKEGFGAQPQRSWSYRFERLPLARLDERARFVVKRAVRFRDG